MRKRMKDIFTVIIQLPDAEPWVSAFDSEKKADAFITKAKERIEKYGMEFDTKVVRDRGSLNSEEYLLWLDYCEEGVREDE